MTQLRDDIERSDRPSAFAADPAAATVVRTPRDGPWVQFRGNWAAMFGLLLLTGIVTVSIIGPWIYSVSPSQIVARPRSAPSMDHPFGVDYLGRDVLAGVIHGGRVTLLVGMIAGLASALIGVLIGSVAGYFGGIVDSGLSRIIEFFQVLPALLFAITLVALWTPSTRIVIFAIATVTWTSTARLARSEFIRLRSMDYVRAARVMGAGDVRIMTRLVLPNAMPTLIVSTTMVIGVAILFEASLAFLGLTDPNVTSWGYMIGASRPFLLDTWWAITYPGLVIFLTVLAVSLVGDGLNDALNPRLRRR